MIVDCNVDRDIEIELNHIENLLDNRNFRPNNKSIAKTFLSVVEQCQMIDLHHASMETTNIDHRFRHNMLILFE